MPTPLPSPAQSQLPIYCVAGELAAALHRCPRLLLQAPTGSGKSTQVPQILLRAGLLEGGELWVLQPRRIAARLLARRVATELGTQLGGLVGYQMRMETRASAETRIRYVTEGVLLRRLLGDPELRGIAAIAFDEFHERHLQSDVGLALCRQLQRGARPDLRLIVMSATLEATGRLAEYLAPAETLVSEGRSFPVDIGYAPPPATAPQRAGYTQRGPARTGIWDHAAQVCAQAYAAGETGDTLIFMPGAAEIRRTLRALEDKGLGRRAKLLPLHGELPPAEQDAAVATYNQPKIVVATNVAETSLTIDGITLVIDSGQARIARYDPARGMDTLLVEPISHASATQRAGRAGRTRPGRCLRLWAESENGGRPPQLAPEIQRVDLAELVLTLRSLPATRAFAPSLSCGAEAGQDPARIFLDEPDPLAWLRAEQVLRSLGALDRAGAPTPAGLAMLEFPLAPRLARMLLLAGDFAHAGADPAVVELVALIAALLQERSPWMRGGPETDAARDRALGVEEHSDLLLAARAVAWAAPRNFDPGACSQIGLHGQTARQAAMSAARYLRMLEGRPATGAALPPGLTAQPPEILARHALLVAFSDQLARRVNAGTARFELVGGRRATLGNYTALGSRVEYLIPAEVLELQRAGESSPTTTLGQNTEIDPAWLELWFPDDLAEGVTVSFDDADKRVTAWEERRFRDLALSRKRSAKAPPEHEAAGILAEAVHTGKITLKGWDHAAEQLIARINFLAARRPELGISPIGPAEERLLIEEVCRGAYSAKEVRERPATPAIRTWLDYGQQSQLDKLAPDRIELPSKRSARINYESGGEARVAVTIQNLFGADRLAIDGGRYDLLLEVCAPNQRPIQITRNLAGFWKEAYPKIRQEYGRKYPRHAWPEDPTTYTHPPPKPRR